MTPEGAQDNGRYQAIRQAYDELGAAIKALEESVGVTYCTRCNQPIAPGTRHTPFNGNQFFACSILTIPSTGEES